MTILNTADRAQLVALVRCKSPEMAPLVQLFENVLKDLKTSLIHAAETERICRLQGKAMVIVEILEAIETAPSILERRN